ncbi:MAG TPA: cell division protein FtsQ/DivIB [Actinotalea sp.]
MVRRPDEVVVATPGTFTDLRRWRPSRPPVVSTGSAARFAERVTLRRNLARRRLVIAGGAVAGLAAVAWTLFFSPVLALDTRDLQVEGEGTVVDVSAVAAVVQVQDGTPLPRLDTVALRRAILDVPGVRAAVVARAWPHGLHITVVSREPVAAVPDGHGFALLDVEGVQVGRGDAPPDGLPVVSVPRDDKDARAMTAVLAVLQELPPELAAQVVSASADTRDTVALGLSDGAKVEWGSPEDGALKVRVLTTLRAAEASKGAAVFDVSAPTLPITRS